MGPTVTFAGAHEEILVFRAATRTCEVIDTPGTWVGGRRDIRHETVETTLKLAPGDTLLLHADGATEIRNAAGEEFGLDRLRAAPEAVSDRSVAEVVEHLVFAGGAWGNATDDATLLVGHYGT